MHYYLSSLLRYYSEPEKFLTAFRNLSVTQRVNTFFISWPKSGRTWLRFLIGKILVDFYHLDPKNLLDIYRLSSEAGCERLMMSHGGRLHFFDSGHYANLRFHKRMFAGKKVIFLIRDIRDLLVSSYFQESRRSKIFQGTIHDFIRDDIFGAQKVVGFYNLWYKNQNQLKNFFLVRYEDLHSDAKTQLQHILDFIQIKNIPDELLDQAIAFSSFSNMKQIEKQQIFKDSMLLHREINDKDSAKIRRGKVGGYLDYLNDADCDYIQSIVHRMKIQGCDWYYYK